MTKYEANGWHDRDSLPGLLQVSPTFGYAIMSTQMPKRGIAMLQNNGGILTRAKNDTQTRVTHSLLAAHRFF